MKHLTKEYLVVLFVAGLFVSTCYADPSVTWVAQYDKIPWGIFPAKVCSTADKGYTLAGTYGDTIVVMHVDSIGKTVWTKKYTTYDSSQYGFHQVNSCKLTSDKGYALAGNRSMSLQTPDMDAWVLRLDSSGAVVWKTTFGSMGWTTDSMYEANDIVETKNHEFVVCGQSNGKPWVARLHTSGNVLWSQSYSGRTLETLCELPDESMMTAGNVLLKINKNGVVLWEKNMMGEKMALVHSSTMTTGGTILLLGETEHFHPLQSIDILVNSVLVCIDTSGNAMWEKEFAASDESYNVLSSMTYLADSELVLAGVTSPCMYNNQQRLWIVRVNANGEICWSFIDTARSYALAVAKASQGAGFVVAAEYYEGQDGNIPHLVNMTEQMSNTSIVPMSKTSFGYIRKAVPRKYSYEVFDVMGRQVQSNLFEAQSGKGYLKGKGIYIIKNKQAAKNFAIKTVNLK